MTFAQPLWFWAVGFLPVLLALFFRNGHVRHELIQKFVAARLAQSLAGNVSNFRRRLRFGMMLCGLGLERIFFGARD